MFSWRVADSAGRSRVETSPFAGPFYLERTAQPGDVERIAEELGSPWSPPTGTLQTLELSESRARDLKDGLLQPLPV